MVDVERIQGRLLKKRKQLSILYKDVESLVDSLQGVCDHSETAEYNWEHDNGYGRQSKVTGIRCVFCGWKSPWDDGRFINTSNITD